MVYSETLGASYLEVARTPCADGCFVGGEVRFSSEYEALESELAKAQSIHGECQPDWQKVRELSECLLRQQSKDLRVATWLTWALYQSESYAGLVAGLGLLRYLCEHHWAAVHPVKLRTRGAAFRWLVLRLEPLFTQGLPTADQQPLFRAILENLSCLDRCWSECLGNDAPLLLPTLRQLTERLACTAQSNPEPAGVMAAVAQVKPTASQPLKPELAIDNEKDAHKRLRTLQDQARPLCNWWLHHGATDLRALRLSRTLAWLALVSYPDADSAGVTSLRGPASDKLKRYQERFAQGHYADLMLELDASLAGAMFWFDGLRMMWECLEALQANLAMTELEVSFALLLQRLPNLPRFCFHDGTPFADASTCDWITLQVTGHLRKNIPQNAPINVDAEPWERALLDVMPTLRKDGLKAAVSELKQGLHAARGERARFHWRLALARLCVLAGKHELAKTQLEHLDHELQHAGLDRWEPGLAIQVAQLLYRSCDLLPQSHAVRERKEETHRKLCRFDLEAVLE